MRILYVGDIMGETGIKTVEEILPKLREEKSIDVVIAQAENVTNGKGIDETDFKKLKAIGIDFCTGGNWSLFRKEIVPFMNDPNEPIIRPANYPTGTPGLGWKYLETKEGSILVISLLGKIVGRDANNPMQNPLQVIDKILDKQKRIEKLVTVVNFHGDYSSEKVIIGHYLDGRVSAVVGDHWHVPTADARILPGGTAHITDVGMCGALDASLGITFESVIPRWRDDESSRNVLETRGKRQFNSVLFEVDNGLSKSIDQIQVLID